MLKTNSKKVLEAMKEEVLSFYTIEELKEDLNAVACGGCSLVYQNSLRLVEGGCFRVYNHDINNFLKNVLEETDEEADRYFEKSFDLYKKLISRAIERLLK